MVGKFCRARRPVSGVDFERRSTLFERKENELHFLHSNLLLQKRRPSPGRCPHSSASGITQCDGAAQRVLAVLVSWCSSGWEVGLDLQ